MKPQRFFRLAVFIVFATAIYLWLNRSGERPSREKAEPALTTSSPHAAPGQPVPMTPGLAPNISPTAPPPPSAPDPAVLPEGTAPVAARPPTPDRLRADLEDVQLALRDFRTGLGENPIGNNAEITKALLGDNLKQLKLEVPAGSQLNDKSELCDRFGTPYFFHQLSATRMEIRSAGADRQMWTADDVQK